MISVKEAIDITLKYTSISGTECTSLLEAKGRILAEDIYSDLDMPPFDKSAMDGYALKFDDVKNAPTILDVVGTIPAGVYPDFTIQSGQAAKIMTGAPLPGGADSVQMVEKTIPHNNSTVEILEPIPIGHHVLKKGEIIRAREKVITQGSHLSAAKVGVLAAFGREQVKIYKRPEVGILVTGDELVEVTQELKPGQIRNSNGYVLYNQVRECGALPELLGIASDNIDELSEKIESGLKKDILLISGGVSMGDLDLVETVFEELEVKIYYNKMNVRPGKPTVFGKYDNCLVFGLPGNPVSASTIFEIIVKPAIRKMMGFNQLHNLKLKAKLEKTFENASKRESFLPAWSFWRDNHLFTMPVPSRGSADIIAFAKSNSFLCIPGAVHLEKGDVIDVILRDEFMATC